jgi:hypothetical protein
MIIGQNSGYTQKVQKKNFTVVRGDTFTYQFDDEFITYVNDIPYTVDLSQCTIIGHIKKNKGDQYPFQFMDFSISDDNQLILHLPTDLTKLFDIKKYYYDVELIIDTTQSDSIPYGTNEDETTGQYEEIVEIGEGGESGYTKPVIGGIPRHVTILSGYIKFIGDITIIDVIKDILYRTFIQLKTKFKEYPAIKKIFSNMFIEITKFKFISGFRYIFFNTFKKITKFSIKPAFRYYFSNILSLSNTYELYPVNSGITPLYTTSIELKITYYITLAS